MLARLLLCCLMLYVAGVSNAVAEPRAGSGCGELHVSFYELGALYYRDANGDWAGIDKDIIDELAKRLGCSFITNTDSRVRIWTNLALGKLDMTVSGISSPEREKLVHVVPYMTDRNFVMLRPDAAAHIDSLESFLATPEYKVAVIKSFKHGVIYDAWLDKLRAQGRVYETSDYSSLLRLFRLRRVDAVLALGVCWVPIVRQERMVGQYRLMDWAPKDNFVAGLVLSRQRVQEASVAQFRRTIQNMRDDGTLKAIFERHVGPELAAIMVNY